MEEKRKKKLVSWKIWEDVYASLEEEAKIRGFGTAPNLVNVILTERYIKGLPVSKN